MKFFFSVLIVLKINQPVALWSRCVGDSSMLSVDLRLFMFSSLHSAFAYMICRIASDALPLRLVLRADCKAVGPSCVIRVAIVSGAKIKPKL